MKREVAASFNVPLCTPSSSTPLIAAAAVGALNLKEARSSALALQKVSSSICSSSSSSSRPAHQIPEHRIQQLEGVVKAFLGRDPAKEPPGLRPGDLEAVLAADGPGQTAKRRKCPAVAMISSGGDGSSEVEEGSEGMGGIGAGGMVDIP